MFKNKSDEVLVSQFAKILNQEKEEVVVFNLNPPFIHDQIEIANVLMKKKAYDTAWQMAEEIQKNSKRINYKTGNSESYILKAAIAYFQGMHNLSLDIYNDLLIICKSDSSQTNYIGGIYNDMGLHYFHIGEYIKSIENYELALNYAQKYPDPKLHIAGIYNNIALLYCKINMLNKSLYYINIAENLLNQDTNSNIVKLKALTYTNKGSFLGANLQYNESDYYFKKAFLLAKESNNNNINMLYDVCINIAESQLNQKNINEALRYLSISDTISNVHPIQVNEGRMRMIQLLIESKELHKAITLINMLLKSTYAKEDKIFAYENLSKINALQKNYAKAYENELMAKSLKDTLNREDQAKTIAHIEAQFRNAEKDRSLAQKEKELAEQQLKTTRAEADGKRKNAWLSIISLGALFLGTTLVLLRYRQINKVRQMQQQKEMEVLRATMEGEEAERVRVGKELHDGVSGYLSAIKMNLISMRMEQQKISTIDAYNSALLLADEAADELRKTAHNLVPSHLAKTGLSGAIRSFCERLSNPKGLQLYVNMIGNPYRLDAEKELAIYRIFQELMHNILKHAQANEVLATMNWLDEVLIITIEDNGIGITNNEPNNGIGNENIIKRMAVLNGNIEFCSGSEGGTTIYLYFPITNFY